MDIQFKTFTILHTYGPTLENLDLEYKGIEVQGEMWHEVILPRRKAVIFYVQLNIRGLVQIRFMAQTGLVSLRQIKRRTAVA